MFTCSNGAKLRKPPKRLHETAQRLQQCIYWHAGMQLMLQAFQLLLGIAVLLMGTEETQ